MFDLSPSPIDIPGTGGMANHTFGLDVYMHDHIPDTYLYLSHCSWTDLAVGATAY